MSPLHMEEVASPPSRKPLEQTVLRAVIRMRRLSGLTPGGAARGAVSVFICKGAARHHYTVQLARVGSDRERRIIQTPYYTLAGTYRPPFSAEQLLEDVAAACA